MSVDTENETLSWSNMYLVKKHKIIQNEVVEVLKLWLMTESKVNEEELKRVWKTLFFKTNKHLTCCKLFEKLSAIAEALDINLARQYFQLFLMAMKKEQGVIDHFNLDNFNHVLGGILCHMHFVLDKNFWDCDLVNKFMGAIVQRTLLAVGKPQGMDSYFADRYLGALHWFLPMPLDSCGHLIEIRLQFKRVKDNAFTCLVENGQNLLKGNQEGQDVDTKKENLGSIGITNSLLQSVTPPSLQDNGPFLDKLGREFVKLYQQLASSGVVVSLYGAMMPKIHYNVATQKLLEVKSLYIHELQADSGLPINHCWVNNAEIVDHISDSENNLNSEMKPRNSELVESTIERCLMCKHSVKHENSNFGSLEKEVNAQAERVQDKMDELNLNHACSYQDVISDNKEKSLEVVSGDDGDTMMIDASAISNLEQQSEEADDDLDNFNSPVASLPTPVSPLNTGSKKRIRELNSEIGLNGGLSSASYHESDKDSVCSDLFCDATSAGGSVQKIAKRVRFSLKNNIVWRPHSPLPPESLRVPPSATPRGSALKRGVPPGPVCIMKKSPRKKPPPKQKSVVVAVRKTARNTKNSSTSAIVSTSSMVLRKHRAVAR
ncbi:uncharacterized protein LOC131065323 isoform X2 [Cryptomeria japonica]|nr:uncharacterized protein LOC131065323 isoform X2 [Cryptomeria japonica]XP_057855792.2 uncharacterized protein LOC131065323 isoform X2 [Cryptomeria japonica]XP_057855793.2 uncharacterized protein LOC131065323 isoform X2 [Cryptomeria japonica]XP_057855794.2 uncharacterized protein LOC131065323 isoform X2 [Cryptomeria japonica]XP_057855795.2 uncharacterized protein LOC131065323 isoform X2 [Cryptomeria japonica]XP_057855796.2 uncharacterized protein LOC131065323 isoform X2 [Cryptomeria japonica]